MGSWALIVIFVVLGLLFLWVVPVALFIQAFVSGAKVGILDLVGMRLKQGFHLQAINLKLITLPEEM
jgi:uncharacterized protein YqfA (UPF0365 family)